MRYGIFNIETGAAVAYYEAGAPDHKSYGGPWGDPTQFEHRVAPVPLDEIHAAKIQEIKDAGFAHVHALYPPHLQRRLAFKAAADTERAACRDLIEAVQARVGTAETAILAMTDPALMDAERDTALADIVLL